eukprot:235871_1
MATVSKAIYCSFFLVVVYQFETLIATNFSHWSRPNSRNVVPYSDCYIGVASYNDTIYLLGGHSNINNHTEFNITSQTFLPISSANKALEYEVHGSGQFYTQINNMFYSIDAERSQIFTYDLVTGNMSIIDNQIPEFVDSNSCLASHKDLDLLFVVGGDPDTGYNEPVSDRTYVYNITSQNWTLDVPAMQTARAVHACIIHPQYNMLYVIGGQDIAKNPPNNYIKSIEKIQINNISNQTWQFVGNMQKGWGASRAIVFHESILVFGGKNLIVPASYSSQVYKISINPDSVHLIGHLPYPVYGTAPIFIHNRIYLFGGGNKNGALNTWVYIDTETLQPTPNPTDQTTTKPSALPTKYPTLDPSTTPILKPSANPTAPPYISPTYYQSTLTPFAKPTTIPTKYPTIDPITPPSVNPTGMPSIAPTIWITTTSINDTINEVTDPHCELVGLFISLAWNTTSQVDSLFSLIRKNTIKFKTLIKTIIHTQYKPKINNKNNVYLIQKNIHKKPQLPFMNISYNITNCNTFIQNLTQYLNSTLFITTLTNNINNEYYSNSATNYATVESTTTHQYHSFLPDP